MCDKTVLVFVCFGTDVNEFLRMELPSALSPFKLSDATFLLFSSLSEFC